MFGWGRKGKEQEPRRDTPSHAAIHESNLLAGGINKATHTLTDDLAALLDHAIALFVPARGLMAEVMITVPSPPQVFTVQLRPDTSVALPMRLRAGDGIAGRVLATGQPYVGRVQPESQTTRGVAPTETVAHLLSTQSAIVVPLEHNEHIVGVLNIESPHADTFGQPALDRLRASGLCDAFVKELIKVGPEHLAPVRIIEDLLDKLRQQIAFAVDPKDITQTYYQILRVSGQVVRPLNVSGGLILLRDYAQNLAANSAAQRLYAVRAARIGAFDSDLEWELTGQSIARRVIQNRKGEAIRDAQHDRDYRSSGTGEAQTSELIVPLFDDDGVYGVIGLVSPGLDAFNQEDLKHLEDVADLAVYAIKRSEEYRTRKRNSDQLAFSGRLLEVLSPLFPDNVRRLSMEQIKQVRHAVSTLILREATEQTASEHGAFVLAQTLEGRPTYLVMDEKVTNAPGSPGVPTRWLASDGVSGAAYTTGVTQTQQSIAQAQNYISYFSGVQSEVATPMRIGETVLGVLDIESNVPDHFTTDRVQWIGFLAKQAAFALATIDRAVKTRIEFDLADLSQDMDKGIEQMRRLELTPELAIAGFTWPQLVRNKRYELVKEVIETLQELTGSWVGRYLATLNPYLDDGRVNEHGGQLFYLVSTDQREEHDTEHRHFLLTQGGSGQAFIEQRMLVFNDRASRPKHYFDSDPGRESLSGIFLPIWEGAQISAILNIENRHEDAFTPEAIRACQIASDLASKVVTAARLRIMELLREDLRKFEIEILRLQSANLPPFLEEVLDRAAHLSYISEGWGTVFLLRRPYGQGSVTTDHACWMNYVPSGNAFEISKKEARPVTYPIYLQALREQKPVLVLDRRVQPGEERVSDPWPDSARSVICVPLLRPSETSESTQLDAVGVLALAHPNAAEFSEFDKEVLRLFAESVIGGLKNIALLQQRKQLVDRMRHDISQAVTPVTHYMDNVYEALVDLETAVTASDLQAAGEEVADVTGMARRVGSLVALVGDLANWFLDLSNDELQPEADPGSSVSGYAVLEPQKGSIIALATVYKRPLEWRVDSDDECRIAGGKVRGRLIRAVLFQYLDNAIKYGYLGKPITVSLDQRDGRVIFAVESWGKPIPEDEQEQIFQLYYTAKEEPDAHDNSGERAASSGIGLFQAREIAGRLKGETYYDPDKTNPEHHRFCLALSRA